MKAKGKVEPKPVSASATATPRSHMLGLRADKKKNKNKAMSMNTLCSALTSNTGPMAAAVREQQLHASQPYTCHVPALLTRSEYRAMAVLKFRQKRSLARLASMNRVSKDVSMATPKRKRQLRGVRRLCLVPKSYELLKEVPNCRHCLAVKFVYESANLCCSDGDITLASTPLPVELETMLLNSDCKEPRGFRVMIRAYNNHLSFTSLGLKYDKKLAQRSKGIYTFRIQGQVYHWINDLMPDEGMPKNLQFYYHDTDYELENRLSNAPELDPDILRKLMKILEVNPYARFFRSLSSVPDLENKQIILKHNPSINHKTYSRPTVSQVAVLLEADENNPVVTPRDIRVYKHGGGAKTIPYHSAIYDGMQYPLIHPTGDPGWSPGIPKNDVKQKKNERLSSQDHLKESVLPTTQPLKNCWLMKN